MSPTPLQMRLKRAIGIDLPQAALDAALRRRSRERGLDDPRACEAEALRSEEELAALIDLVVVPESWFFRDEDAFTAARAVVERKLNAARPVRILSIPCACGEEPYSLAMALLDAGIAPGAFEIDAADVNHYSIERARHGIYSRNAFRSRDLSFRDRHFSRCGQDYELDAAVRRMVRFHCTSLLEAAVAPEQRYDVVFCRNLLIYFDARTQREAIARLDGLLCDDGVLFAGYAEVMTFCQHHFLLLPVARAFALKKKEKAPIAPTVPAAPAVPPVWNWTAPPAAAATADKQGTASPEAAGQEALLARARLLADHDEVSAAIEAYRACLRQAPDLVEAHFMLGLLSERAGDAAAAEQHLRRAVYLDPGHYEALCHLALLAQRAGDEDGAAGFRRRAARVHARNSGTGT